MDRRSWLWRRKSSDKSPGETESSGSMSSLSERFSDEQGYPANRSQSLEVTSKAADPDEEADESVKTLSERLSAALLNISAKEELVKQHAKVAEEAVSGWEKAENEVSALKKQLEAASQKNASLEYRVGYLDGALKECVRQLRQAREEQEEKISEVIAKKTLEWESIKADLEKENAALHSELLSRVEELEMMTIERDLSTGAAESASKQHLESIKRVSKLEAECLRLKAVTRKALTANNDLKSFSTSSVCIESFTDSQSDAGERNEWARSPLVMEFDNFKKDKALGKSLAVSSPEIGLMDDFLEMERLAAQPNQSIGLENENLLKSELEAMINRTAELEEELEKKEAEKAELIVVLTKCRQQLDASQTQQKEAEEKLKVANVSMMKRTSKLEKETEEKEAEKAELVVALGQCKQQLDTSLKQLKEAEEKLKSANARMIKRTAKLEEEIEKKEAEKAELVLDLSQHRKQLDTSLTRIKEAEEKLKAANASIEATESQMREMDLEMKVLVDKVKLLEENIEREHVLLDERSEKCRTLEDEILKMKKETEHQHVAISGKELKLKQDQELAVAASRFADCQKTIASLGQKLKSLASLEDFLAESVEMLVVMDEGLEYPQNGKAEHKLETGGFYIQKRNSDYSKPSRDVANLGKNTTEKIQHGLVRFPSRGKDRHLN